MRHSTLLAAAVAAAVLLTANFGFAAGTDEPKPAPKPPSTPEPKSEPKPAPNPDNKPDTKPDTKEAPKEAPKAQPGAALDPDYVAGKEAVVARDWKRAIALLERAEARDPKDANVHNYLGFANRNDGNWEAAMKHYRTALALNPEHRGATEYMGHAFLLRGNLTLAQAQLSRLERICGRGCEEYASLSRAIDDYRVRPK
jgi:tetratricopeptide (TPR) repeat protein